MVAFSDNVATIWRRVSDIEKQIAEETRRQREQMSRLEGERDELLLKLLDQEGAHDRRFVAGR
jgi:hypothetical protein